MSARPDHFMPLYIGDYLADTSLLTRDQHGGYLLLIMTYWRNRGPLPDDDQALAAATRSTPAEWKRLRPVLARYFKVADGVWRHGRIDDELQRADEKYAARVNASRKANGVRHGVRNGDRDGDRNGDRNGDANGHRHGSQPQPQPYSLGKPSESARARRTWPPDAVVPENWIRLAAEQRRLAGLPPIDLQVSARMFANFYAADTSNPRTMAEYQAKWANWALKEKPDDQPARSKRSTAGDTLRELARLAAEADGNLEPDMRGR